MIDERGEERVRPCLRIEVDLLVVSDAAKGLHAAVREVFGSAGLLQRCQWHKRENALAYLPERAPRDVDQRHPLFRPRNTQRICGLAGGHPDANDADRPVR